MAVDVSVVIPCYNGSRFIGETLRAAIATVGVELEIVVVDDGSSDDSATIIREMAATDPRVRMIQQPNSGVALARNVGIGASLRESRYVLFLDADDLVLPEAIARMMNRLDTDSDLIAAVGTCSRIDEHGELLTPAPDLIEAHRVDPDGRIIVSDSVDRIGYWHLLPINPIPTPGMCLLRRRSLPATELFDPACIGCEDWDLWIRLSRAGDFGLVGGEVLRYRDHAKNASKDFASLKGHRAAVYDKQSPLIISSERRRFVAAYRYGMFKFDAQLCWHWSRAEFGERRIREGARLALRALRYELGLIGSLLRREPRRTR
jgi:glycosyltransferase involved in cell wall biosynthesis